MFRSVSCSGFLDLTLSLMLSPARQMAVPAVSLGVHHEQFLKSHMQAMEQGKDHWAKTPFRSKDICSIRVHLQMQHRSK